MLRTAKKTDLTVKLKTAFFCENLAVLGLMHSPLTQMCQFFFFWNNHAIYLLGAEEKRLRDVRT